MTANLTLVKYLKAGDIIETCFGMIKLKTDIDPAENDCVKITVTDKISVTLPADMAVLAYFKEKNCPFN